MVIEDMLATMPKEERLPYALSIIRTLRCDNMQAQARYQSLGLTPNEARILNYLVIRAGRICTPEQLHVVVWGSESDHTIDNFASYIGHIRKKIPWINIQTQRLLGYILDPADAEKLAVKLDPLEVPPTSVDQSWERTAIPTRMPWTEAEDNALLRMRQTNFEWWAIANDLRRTERAVTSRYHTLTTTGRPVTEPNANWEEVYEGEPPNATLRKRFAEFKTYQSGVNSVQLSEATGRSASAILRGLGKMRKHLKNAKFEEAYNNYLNEVE